MTEAEKSQRPVPRWWNVARNLAYGGIPPTLGQGVAYLARTRAGWDLFPAALLGSTVGFSAAIGVLAIAWWIVGLRNRSPDVEPGVSVDPDGSESPSECPPRLSDRKSNPGGR